MTGHVAYIHTRTPGPVKVAVCACGWESTPSVTTIGALHARDGHMAEAMNERQRTDAAPRALPELTRRSEPMHKHCCPSLITEDHTDHCRSRQAEIEEAERRVEVAEAVAQMAAHDRDEALANFARAEQEYADLLAERDRFIRVVFMLGGIERIAQCPSCEAERTMGEWHTDDCPMVAGVERPASADHEPGAGSC